MEHHLQIDGWRSNIRFSSCHMLLRHDKCSRLHGHSYAVHLKVAGDLDENHMLADFGEMKKALRAMVEELDHKTLIPTMNPDIIISEDRERESITVDMMGKVYTFPACDTIKVPVPATTVEELSIYLLDRFMDMVALPGGVREISLGVDEGWGQGAWSTRSIRE
ncbi:MAG: 6-pyruvoyl trahydropterin synthase family protein [Thermoplasmatota archaeon]